MPVLGAVSPQSIWLWSLVGCNFQLEFVWLKAFGGTLQLISDLNSEFDFFHLDPERIQGEEALEQLVGENVRSHAVCFAIVLRIA